MISIILSSAVSSYATINVSMSGNKTVQKAEKLAKAATERKLKSSSKARTKSSSKADANSNSKTKATDAIERLFRRVVLGSFLGALILAVVVTIVIDQLFDIKSMAGSSYIDIYLLTLSVLVAIAVGVSATLFCKWWALLYKYNSLPLKKAIVTYSISFVVLLACSIPLFSVIRSSVAMSVCADTAKACTFLISSGSVPAFVTSALVWAVILFGNIYLSTRFARKVSGRDEVDFNAGLFTKR